jgi:solute carrier family 45 protein 1/2/4
MFLLTASLIGLQFCWGTEQTYATPYLLALGLSKGGMSLVWIAGPLSGLIMQPIIGMVSDKSTSKYGRRRPFMVVGTVAVAVCLLILGWAKEMVAYFVVGAEERRRMTVWVAVVDIYVLDFVINVGKARGKRAREMGSPVKKKPRLTRL